MNKAVIQTNTAEVLGAVRQQPKTKGPADNNGFKDMLSSALGSDGSSGTQTSQNPKTTNAEPTGKQQPENTKNPAQNTDSNTAQNKIADVQESEQGENIEDYAKLELDPAIAAALQAKIAPEPQQTTVIEDVQAEAIDTQTVKLNPVQSETAPIPQNTIQTESEPVQQNPAPAIQTETAPTTTEKTPEQQQRPMQDTETEPIAVSDKQTAPKQREVTPVQTNDGADGEKVNQAARHGDKNAQRPEENATVPANTNTRHNKGGQVTENRQKTDPEESPKLNIKPGTDRTVQTTSHRASIDPQAAAPERQTAKAPEVLERITIDGGKGQVVRQPAVTDRQIGQEQQIRVTDSTTHTKFDEMLAKAAQELGQGKAVQQEHRPESTNKDFRVQPQTDGGDKEKPAKTQAEPKDETFRNVTAQVRTQGNLRQAVATAHDTVQKVAKQPRETAKVDEAVHSMTGTKQPEALVREIVARPAEQVANPVKVPEQAEQIRMQVIKNLENEKMEFNMRLHPEELGRVDVKMILQSGKLAVEIIAATPKAAELLTKQAEGLIASLKMGNLDVSSVNIVTASSTASGHMEGQFNMNNFQNQAGTQERDGYGENGKGSGQGQSSGFDEDSAQQEHENPEAALGRLNYSV